VLLDGNPVGVHLLFNGGGNLHTHLQHNLDLGHLVPAICVHGFNGEVHESGKHVGDLPVEHSPFHASFNGFPQAIAIARNLAAVETSAGICKLAASTLRLCLDGPQKRVRMCTTDAQQFEQPQWRYAAIGHVHVELVHLLSITVVRRRRALQC
jgi:hypothetical protein